MTFVSGGWRLESHLARAPTSAARDATRNGVVIVHDLPFGPGRSASAGSTFPALADRIAHETGWGAFTFTCRGAGRSPGEFSPDGWLADVTAAVELLRQDTPSVWLAGFGFGGALALRVAALDDKVGGVAVLGAPTDFDAWIRHPGQLAAAVHESGMVDTATPAGLEEWPAQLRALDPLGAAHAIPPRPFLIIHGSADDTVPVHDARALADAGEGNGELHVIPMASGALRHDPRAVAILLGWLERDGA